MASGSREDPKIKELIRVLIEWINDELADQRIIVKDIEEDLFDGQVLQKLIGKFLFILKLQHMQFKKNYRYFYFAMQKS